MKERAPHQFNVNEAIAIARRAKLEGARWESAVRDYCTIECGGSEEDARIVANNIRRAVAR